MSLSVRLHEDEGGYIALQLAALIVGPIIAAVIALTALTVIRTGTDLTGAMQRDALAGQMMADLKASVGTASTISVDSARQVSVSTTPNQLPAALATPVKSVGTVCTTTTWLLSPAGSAPTLTMIRMERQSTDCSSNVVTTTRLTLTGLQDGVTFQFVNRAGRPGTVGSGPNLTLTPATKPVGVTDTAWAESAVGGVLLNTKLAQAFGDRPLVVTALRP